MRSVGRNVHRLAGMHGRLLATEGCLHLAFEQDKGLLKVMPVWRRAASRRDMHINYAEASIGLLTCDGDCVGIADEANVRELVGLRKREIASRVIYWYRHLVSSRSRIPKRGGFFGKIFVPARSTPQQLRKSLDVSGFRSETTFEVALEHHADVESRP